ncbi:hypothetical protein GCM10010521_43800 [Streptomyces rameus]|uniref:Uncharacterized protein n=1 Tax=Streptomyces rameus TaxID=68261 RepID=A0ABP6NMH6_9ACTN
MLAAQANFVTAQWAAGLGALSGSVALYSGLLWQERTEYRQALKAWQAAVMPGPAGSGVTDAAAQRDSVLAALNPDREIAPFSPLRSSAP